MRKAQDTWDWQLGGRLRPNFVLGPEAIFVLAGAARGRPNALDATPRRGSLGVPW